MMQTGQYVTLTRFAHLDTGTYGRMQIGDRVLWTAERAWKNNKRFVSCIPDGSYEVVRHNSPKFGWCFAVVGDGVSIYEGSEQRYGILFHAANWPDELQGCIAPGMSFAPIPVPPREWPDNLGVTQSATRAFPYLMSVMPDVWHLEICGVRANVA